MTTSDRTADSPGERPPSLPGQPVELGETVLDGRTVSAVHRGGQAWVLVLDGPDGRRALKLPATGSGARDTELAAVLGLPPHERVVTVLDVVEFRGRQGILLEHVPDTLDGLRRRRTDATSLLTAAQEICDGMAHLSDSAEFAHLDLKPSNVLVDDAGHVKIADFGLAHGVRTPEGRFRVATGGTWAYAAPEVLRGEPCDARADVFSFGVLLHELCTGRWPYPFELASTPGAQRAQLLAWYDSAGPRQRADELYRGGVSARSPDARWNEIGEVLSGCLQTDMGERPPTFRHVAATIAWATHVPETRADPVRLPELDRQRREMTLCATLSRLGRLDESIRRLNRLLCTAMPAPLSADAVRALREALTAAGRVEELDHVEAWR